MKNISIKNITWSLFSISKHKCKFGIDPKARYQIFDWHIIDTSTRGLCYYIRELIEIGCHEFDHSEIPAVERLMVIESVGQDRIVELLRQNFKIKKRPFDEKYNALDGIQALKKN